MVNAIIPRGGNMPGPQRGQHRNIPPCDIPPTYDMEWINWAHKGFTQEQYSARLERIRKLSMRQNQIPRMPLSEFRGNRYLDIMEALLASFRVVSRGTKIKTLEELVSLSPTIPPQLVERGAFTNPRDNRSQVAYTQLLPTDMSGVLLDVKKYSLLPGRLKDYLNIHLLLIAQTQNPYRAAVELLPKDFRQPVDNRYLEFYERLADMGISGVFSIGGAESFFHSWLGHYDREALTDPSRPLFPQNEAFTVPASAKGNKAIVPGRVANNSEGILHRYRKDDGIQDMLKGERKSKVSIDGVVDEGMTKAYHKALEPFIGGGSIYFPVVHENLEQAMPHLTEEQVAKMGLAVVDYIFRNIQTGNIPNLNGIGEIGADLDLFSASFLPEVAGRIKLYHQNLPKNFLYSILVTRLSSGYLSSKVYDIWTEKECEDREKMDDTQFGETRKGRHYSHYANLENHSPYQEEYMGHMIEVIQDKLPGFKVDDRVVCEIMEYGEILFMLKGGQDWVFEQLDRDTAVFIVKFLEYNMGEVLPDLRREILRNYRRRDGPGLQETDFQALPAASERRLPKYD